MPTWLVCLVAYSAFGIVWTLRVDHAFDVIAKERPHDPPVATPVMRLFSSLFWPLFVLMFIIDYIAYDEE